MRKIVLILLTSLFIFTASHAIADTQYVSDELIITLRRGEGDQYKILKMLKTGTPVEILQEGATGYVFVRTSDGTEGWVRSQYLTSEMPKKTVIARLEKERERQREQIDQVEIQRAELTAELENIREDFAERNAAFTDLEKELDKVQEKYRDLETKAENVVQLAEERDRLKAQKDQLSVEVDQLRKKNKDIFFNGAIKWFLAGAGVLLAGVILGKTSKRKKGFS